MKKVFPIALITSTLLLSNNGVKADYEAFGVSSNGGASTVYSINTISGERTALTTRTPAGGSFTGGFVNAKSGELILPVKAIRSIGPISLNFNEFSKT